MTSREATRKTVCVQTAALTVFCQAYNEFADTGSGVQEARQLFKSPDVLDKDTMPALVWKAPDVDGLIEFLCREKQFSEERVRSSIDKMAAAKNKANQNRMESFFKACSAGPRSVRCGACFKRNYYRQKSV